MKIALGTQNKAKLSAVEAFLETEGIKDYDLVAVNVESGVSDMPMSSEECIEGAINRAKNALAGVSDAEMSIGMEGGVATLNGVMFLCGWVAIVDGNGNMGVGASGYIEVPQLIREELEVGKELGPLLGELHKRDIKNNEGAWGIFSDGRITRSQSFQISLKAAFSKLVVDVYK